MAKRSKPVPVTPLAPVSGGVAHDTKDWIRNAADERAAKAGYVFDGERGIYVCNWIETNCYLYEGPAAGRPMKLIPYMREFVMRLYSWVYDSDDWNEYVRRFNRANLLCAKKNGKTPFLAANGLYLTCADGESGQKVYTTAKNGKQAGLTQGHAIAMAEQSPNLKAPVCVVNKSTSTITHVETRSKMLILAGDDTRGAQANEGINGSILIDELHVVDREMHERTKGAGISRKEPINLAMSTAGDDPSSYGFERTEYGREVNAGKKNDPHFLHVEYAAPQNAKDKDIAENLEEYARAANPALGHLVRMKELKDDYEGSKDKPREMARCKQYRFNIWVGSTNPWLDSAKWELCRRTFLPELFRDREVRLGIDLSRTRDMTSVVFNCPFPEEGESVRYLWALFWLPERRAESLKNLFPYYEWAERGDLTLTDGDVVNYKAVESDACSLAESCGMIVTDIYFDQTYAEELTQRMSDRLDCNRTAVSQTLMTLSPLAKEFERGIEAGYLRHPGNAVLDWQVGHVKVYTDRNQNIRPVKPEPMSGKSIDGIMASLNTFAADRPAEGGEESGPSIFFG